MNPWFTDTRYEFRRLKERWLLKFVWALPNIVAYWCAMRVFAHATQGPYGNEIVTEVKGMDAIERFRRDKGLY